MLKIQNLACIPIRITPDDNVIPVTDTRLIGKKVNAMYFFTPSQEDEINSPYSPSHLLTPISDVDNLNLFLNISDHKNVDIIKDLPVKNITVQTLENKFLDTDINTVLNIYKCFINSKSDITISPTMFLYVLYQTDHFSKQTDEVNGAVTIHIPVSVGGEDYRLSDYVGATLNGKRIKKILSTQNHGGYLNLISKDERRKIENVPLSFFHNGYFMKQSTEPKLFTLDPMVIDFEKSYLYDRRFGLNEDYKITFIY